MIIERVLSLLGVGLTIPQIVAESSRFDAASFNTWIQFLPQAFLLVALVLKSFKKTSVACLVFAGLALLGVYFLLIFNSQSSSYVICSKFSSICAEVDDISCTGNVLEPWEALLYLIGLCFCIIGITILIKTTITDYSKGKVTAVEKFEKN